SGGGSGGDNSGGSDGGTTGENDGDTQGPKISGTLTTSSPLEGSILCLDTNDNQQCDDGEPSAIPDEQGNWEINLGEDGAITEDTRVVFVP
ncbi:hypothetical protein, partial [Priestia megaterium]|uniref:hypothetical protein n=1 Tax=Priestia megaterium TaxID=1404 RepID=UPI0035B656E1